MSVVPVPTSVPAPGPAPAPRRPAPPLENGDRLTRVEFERRYNAMPGCKKAELIEGLVHMPSAVRFTQHGKPHAILVTWLGYYAAKTPGLTDFGDNATLRLDEDNVPQPDACLRLPPHVGGRSRIADDGYLEGPVELVVEVASSSVSIDLHAKLNVYRRHGVREYLVWRTDDAAIDLLAFRAGLYEPIAPDAAGILRSETFPGLWLDVPAALAHDLPKLLATLDQGLATPEHADFVKRLAAKP